MRTSSASSSQLLPWHSYFEYKLLYLRCCANLTYPPHHVHFPRLRLPLRAALVCCASFARLHCEFYIDINKCSCQRPPFAGRPPVRLSVPFLPASFRCSFSFFSPLLLHFIISHTQRFDSQRVAGCLADSRGGAGGGEGSIGSSVTNCSPVSACPDSSWPSYLHVFCLVCRSQIANT